MTTIPPSRPDADHHVGTVDCGDRIAWLIATALPHQADADAGLPITVTRPAVRVTITPADSLDVIDWSERFTDGWTMLVAMLNSAGADPVRAERMVTVARSAAVYEHARSIPAAKRSMADALALAFRAAYRVHASHQRHGWRTPTDVSTATVAINGAVAGVRAVLAAASPTFDGSRFDDLSFPWPETEDLGWWN